MSIYETLKVVMPEVIGAVITKKGKINVCPVNFQAVSSAHENPLVVIIGLSNIHYSLKILLETKQFVYALPSQPQLEDIIYCGTVSGRDTDKVASTSLMFTESKKVSPPNLKDAVVNFECELNQFIKLDNFTLVIGNILQINSNPKTDLKKIYALGGMNYGVIQKTTVLKTGRS